MVSSITLNIIVIKSNISTIFDVVFVYKYKRTEIERNFDGFFFKR